jgi:hypothetical protein
MLCGPRYIVVDEAVDNKYNEQICNYPRVGISE